MLTKEEMINTTGGNARWGVWGIIGAGFVLFTGVLDGFLRPFRCN